MTATMSPTAREAVGSACAEVRAGEAEDAVDGVAAGLVARPADTGQVAEVLRAAAAHRLTVVPRGRGTKLTWGVPPRRADVVLDLAGLDRVLEHAAGDLIAVAQAGTRLADLQRRVAEGGQRLALDETVPGASVGGTLATNASGSRRLAGGTARDLLIGITVVRADGVVAKAGGKVVKNVAGYDLGKLMVGSLGTLAVVTEAVFRLHPVPRAHRWVSAPAADPMQAGALVQAVLRAQVVPSALEVVWPPGASGSVHVLLEGREAGVGARARAAATAMAALLEGPGSLQESDAPPAGDATYPWDTDARDAARHVAVKLTFRLSGLADVLAAAGAVGADVRGSAGAGVGYAALPPDTPPDVAREDVLRLRAACSAARGSAVVVDAPAAVKPALDVWGPVPGADLMRRVKDQFDPDHRLSPGRFVGGI